MRKPVNKRFNVNDIGGAKAPLFFEPHSTMQASEGALKQRAILKAKAEESGQHK